MAVLEERVQKSPYLAVCSLVSFVSLREGISKRDSRNQAWEVEEDSRTAAEQFWGVLEGNARCRYQDNSFFGASKMLPIVESMMNVYKWFNMRHTTPEAYSPSYIPLTLFKNFESQELSPPIPVCQESCGSAKSPDAGSAVGSCLVLTFCS